MHITTSVLALLSTKKCYYIEEAFPARLINCQFKNLVNFKFVVAAARIPLFPFSGGY